MDEKQTNRGGFVRGVILGAAGMLVLLGILTGVLVFMIGHGIKKTGRGSGTAADLAVMEDLNMKRVRDKLDILQSYVDEYYLFTDKTTADQREAGIYKGYMSGLNDVYSTYYTPEEWTSMQENTSGSYVGIGALVNKNIQTGQVSLVKVFSGSPAESAGLMAGDILSKVDGEDVSGQDLDVLVSQHIRGDAGSQVTITVYRPSTGENLDLSVTRGAVEVETVTGRMLGDTGLITVSEFDTVTAEQFTDTVDSLQAQGAKKLIIDLRNNPGGALDTVLKMADYILPGKDKLLSVVDKNGGSTDYYEEDDHSVDLPMAILVNGNSASASEVFTGAMKDYHKAVIVGTKTFGKGIVQSVFSLNDGSAVKITTDHYYTPGGQDIHGKGIEPDVTAELDPEVANQAVIPQDQDTQLQKALEVLGE